MTLTIPPLEPNCNSWIVVRNDTGKPIYETTDREIVTWFKPDLVTVYTALQWLQKFNAQVKADTQ
jgi:hypothetical protein